MRPEPLPVIVTPATFKASAVSLASLKPAPVLYQPGFRSILVTSVHGYSHLRDGAVKAKDSGTLEASHAIAYAAGASWLAVGEDGAIDSNHHTNTPFKEELSQVLLDLQPHLVLDIHASNAMRPFDVELGSHDQASWLGQEHWRDALEESLTRTGFWVTDNQVFRAYGSTPDAETITTYCRTRRVPCVQLELNSALIYELDTRQALHTYAKLVNALAAFIVTLEPRR